VNRKTTGLPVRTWVLAALAMAATAPTTVLHGQAPPRINGRVVDQATGEPVVDATVTLTYRAAPDSISHTVVTNALGLFRVERTRSGEYDVTVEHISYGTFTDGVTLTRGESLALRVGLSPSAIELSPVVVEAIREGTRADRARGTARRVVTAEELAPVAETWWRPRHTDSPVRHLRGGAFGAWKVRLSPAGASPR